MQRTSLIIFLIAAALISGCTTGKRTTKLIDADNDGRFEQTVVNTDNLSQRTLRLQEKVTMATALCSLESNNLSDPDRRLIADVEGVKIYSQNIVAFNMEGCIAESLRWGGERLMNTVINKSADLLNLGIKGYAAVSVAKRVFDNQGVKVDNVAEGATVAIGTDQAPVDIDQRSDRAGDGSTYNTCAGDLIDGECVLPTNTEPDDEDIDPFACGIGDTCIDAAAYLGGFCGPIDPVVASCLSGF